MSWMETIRLLASGDRMATVLDELAELIAGIEQDRTEATLRVFSRPAFEADLLVCIRWNRRGSPRKSREGLTLAEYLTRFGMVDHAIWKQELPPGEIARIDAPPD